MRNSEEVIREELNLIEQMAHEAETRGIDCYEVAELVQINVGTARNRLTALKAEKKLVSVSTPGKTKVYFIPGFEGKICVDDRETEAFYRTHIERPSICRSLKQEHWVGRVDLPKTAAASVFHLAGVM